MATTWSRKYHSYNVQIDPETGLAVRISIEAQIQVDGGSRLVEVPDPGQYDRASLAAGALTKLDEFTALVEAKYDADNALPAD